MTFHGMRHEHAALLVQGGVPLVVVSKRLGHASINITSNTYGHLLPAADRDVAAAFAAVMAGRGTHAARTAAA